MRREFDGTRVPSPRPISVLSIRGGWNDGRFVGIVRWFDCNVAECSWYSVRLG
jgi:hypothetical protein